MGKRPKNDHRSLILDTVIKKLGSLIFMIWLALPELSAQHCPFDGLYTIAIRISKADKAMSATEFYLLEKETTRKDSCRFTNYVDSTRFLTEKEVKAEMEEDPHSTRSRYLPERLKGDQNFLKGNQVVFLNMSAKDCMVEKGNEYEMLPRQLVIRYTCNGRQIELDVPKESIYSLCGAYGSWKRIKPLELPLP
jgi:hypothetical protein